MPEISRGDVKPLKCVLKFFSWKITDQIVEHSESVSHLPCLLDAVHHIQRDGGSDVTDATPEIAMLFNPVSVGVL